MTQQFKDFLAELEPLPSWVRSDMNKIQKLDRAKVDSQNLLHRIARNFFKFSDKNKKKPQVINKEKRRAVEKIKILQQKIQVMSTQKVDLANKIMQFAELNIDKILKDNTAAEQTPTGSKARRETKAQEKASKQQKKVARQTVLARQLQPSPPLVQPVSFELNCQLLRGFGPPIALNSIKTLEQIQQNRRKAANNRQNQASTMSPNLSSQRSLVRTQSNDLVRANSVGQSKADRVPAGPGQEPTYCFCNNVSYGDMIACDNDACLYEWFHFPCISLSQKPGPGELWYCQKCAPSFQRTKLAQFN